MDEQRYRLVRDDSGHQYIIPEEQVESFHACLEGWEEGGWQAFEDNRFDDYRVNRSGWTFTDPQGWQ